MATPPVRASASLSSLSQRGVQPLGRRRSETAMSAAAQAAVMLVQPIRIEERVASRRFALVPLPTTATQASCEQSLVGCPSRTSGSPSNPDASASRLRT
jgi:hypothetical protein